MNLAQQNALRFAGTEARGGFGEAWLAAAPDSRLLMAELLDAVEPHQQVLEIGCGAGGACNQLAWKGYFRVTGVEGDAAAVDRARLAAEQMEVWPPPRFVVAEAAALPFADGQFAAVVVRSALTRLVSPAQHRDALREASRVLAPAGRLYLSAVAKTCYTVEARARYEVAERLTGHRGTVMVRDPQTWRVAGCEHHFGEQELADLLMEAGFEIERFQYESFATPHVAGRRLIVATATKAVCGAWVARSPARRETAGLPAA